MWQEGALKNKGKFYRIAIRQTLLDEYECWSVKKKT